MTKAKNIAVGCAILIGTVTPLIIKTVADPVSTIATSKTEELFGIEYAYANIDKLQTIGKVVSSKYLLTNSRTISSKSMSVDNVQVSGTLITTVDNSTAFLNTNNYIAIAEIFDHVAAGTLVMQYTDKDNIYYCLKNKDKTTCSKSVPVNVF